MVVSGRPPPPRCVAWKWPRGSIGDCPDPRKSLNDWLSRLEIKTDLVMRREIVCLLPMWFVRRVDSVEFFSSVSNPQPMPSQVTIQQELPIIPFTHTSIRVKRVVDSVVKQPPPPWMKGKSSSSNLQVLLLFILNKSYTSLDIRLQTKRLL